MITVGESEAESQFPKLLDRVSQGEEIQITRHGRPVARLVPEPEPETTDVQTVIAEILKFRKGRRLGDDLTIRQLIEEGRRF
ncbi:MAG: type II toxin-antitoxin system prevent-host-death family antitoxin [Isosphaeraceae bacterium]